MSDSLKDSRVSTSRLFTYLDPSGKPPPSAARGVALCSPMRLSRNRCELQGCATARQAVLAPLALQLSLGTSV